MLQWLLLTRGLHNYELSPLHTLQRAGVFQLRPRMARTGDLNEVKRFVVLRGASYIWGLVVAPIGALLAHVQNWLLGWPCS